MQCPHCLQPFQAYPRVVDLGRCGEDKWTITLDTCPNCNDAILMLYRTRPVAEPVALLFPTGTSPTVAKDVPANYAEDYVEAARLLHHSPKASAALGRRCLRRLFDEMAGLKDVDLNKAIETLVASKHLPKHLADAIDQVRHLSNLAANPRKSTHPGEIGDSAPGEAEWILDTLDGLFQYYFVQPAAIQRKRAALLATHNVAWQNPP
jgi:hypothetical protein